VGGDAHRWCAEVVDDVLGSEDGSGEREGHDRGDSTGPEEVRERSRVASADRELADDPRTLAATATAASDLAGDATPDVVVCASVIGDGGGPRFRCSRRFCC